MRLLTISLTALVFCAGCDESAAQSKASAPEAATSALLSQRGLVHVQTRDGRELRLEVEIASNARDRARGLMHRKQMPEMSGMYFVFADEGPRSFWMKNTLIPLDMLFIGADGRVVGIVENAEPLTLTSRSVGADSKDVLEVNGGWCARRGVRPGDRVRLEGMYQLE